MGLSPAVPACREQELLPAPAPLLALERLCPRSSSGLGTAGLWGRHNADRAKPSRASTACGIVQEGTEPQVSLGGFISPLVIAEQDVV